MTYIEPDLQDDETAVAEANLAALADFIPGFVPSEASIETLFAEALAIGQATANALIKDTERNAFAGMGELVLGVVRGIAAPARTQATITVGDTAGHLIPAGYQVVMLTADGDSVTLASTTDATVIAPATTVAGVLFEALEPGVDGNGAAGAAIDRDPLAFVAKVVLEQPTAGGVDEEDLAFYVARVARAARRRSFLPLTPADYAGAAQDVTGVARALALNRTNPDVAGDQPGHITIKAATATGDPVPAAVKTAITQASVAQEQVLGAVVHVADAVIVTINVAVTVVRDTASADVVTQASAAIRALLNKATWNADASEAGGWRKGVGTVTTYDVSAAIDDLKAIRQVVTVTLNAPAAPTAPTATPSTTGGTLAAGAYYYKVSALDASGESAGSTEVSAVTTGTTSSVALAWAASAGATGYRIYRGTAAGAENVYYAPAGTATTFTDTGGASTSGTPRTVASGGTAAVTVAADALANAGTVAVTVQ